MTENLVASGVRTRIVGAVGENADHYTNTTALPTTFLIYLLIFPQEAVPGKGGEKI